MPLQRGPSARSISDSMGIAVVFAPPSLNFASMNWNGLLVKFLVWRIRNVSDKNFLLILAAFVGIVAGLAAVALKETVHHVQHMLEHNFGMEHTGALFIAFPLVGILITVLFCYLFISEPLGHGITGILFAISKQSSNIKRGRMYDRLITSAITVGFGGSVGLEAPIVVTGSAIGSNMGGLMHLNYKKRTLMIGCGAAAAISAIFNSPIAGVIFCIEVILTDVTIAALTPLLISSVFGSLVSFIISGNRSLFAFKLTDPFTAADVPFYFMLGIFCGLVSLYFVRTMYRVEPWINKVSNIWLKALLGGALLSIIIVIFNPIYGEGYDTIKEFLTNGNANILSNHLFIPDTELVILPFLFLTGLILIKPVASALTIGSGGSGGIFAPSLFIGAVTGFLFSSGINTLANDRVISTSNFTLVGMCGILSGVLHAPLTAIFLIAEITSGYTLFVPLMLVSAISYSTISYFEKHSFYTKHLVEKGDLIPNDRDRQVLSLIHLRKVIETDLHTIHPEKTLDDLVKLVRKSRRNIFPVVNHEEQLEGIVTLDDIREVMFDDVKRKEILVSSIMHAAPDSVSPKEKMQSVMAKFEKTGAWNLPVIEDGRYQGFVSKSRIFNAYRQKLIRQARD